MTTEQLASFALLGVTMAALVHGRLRYDVVALLSLLAAVLIGVVPRDQAFRGFSDDIVILVGSALVISAAVGRSGVMERITQRVFPAAASPRMTVVLLVTTVAALSAFVKNIGALALMMPIALRLAVRAGIQPSCVLMPMSFGALLGGLITLVGTSPNIIVSRVKTELTGAPFAMFDFAPVGVGITLAGILFLAFAYRTLPARHTASRGMHEALEGQAYSTEARVELGGDENQSVSELRRTLGPDVTVAAVIRDGVPMAPLPDASIRDQDAVILEGKPAALQEAVTTAALKLDTPSGQEPPAPEQEIKTIEAVIGPSSILVGQTAARLVLARRFNILLLAVSRGGQRFTERLRDITLREGDLIVIQGDAAELPDKLQDLGCLPLAERNILLGSVRHATIPIAALAGAVLVTSFEFLPVAVAFFAAAVVIVALRALPLREAYAAIDWPILVLLGSLIPLSEAIRANGGADLLADQLASLGRDLPASAMVGAVMVFAMAVTPFLNNAATVLVMAPIAVGFAQQLGLNPEPFLMAVAIGAGCDFLTPTGHQCNTMVYEVGGYRFGDYARLGAPLSLIVIAVSVPLILLIWPLQ